jgi:hypothetical protein
VSAHTCDSRVRTSDGWASYRCGNKAAYEHNDKHFCKRHHPPTVEAKQAAKHAAWNAEQDSKYANLKLAAEATTEQKRRADLYPDLLAALIGMVESYEHEASAINPALLAAFAAIAAATGKPGEQK